MSTSRIRPSLRGFPKQGNSRFFVTSHQGSGCLVADQRVQIAKDHLAGFSLKARFHMGSGVHLQPLERVLARAQSVPRPGAQYRQAPFGGHRRSVGPCFPRSSRDWPLDRPTRLTNLIERCRVNSDLGENLSCGLNDRLAPNFVPLRLPCAHGSPFRLLRAIAAHQLRDVNRQSEFRLLVEKLTIV